jgi:hypothetical protein
MCVPIIEQNCYQVASILFLAQAGEKDRGHFPSVRKVAGGDTSGQQFEMHV